MLIHCVCAIHLSMCHALMRLGDKRDQHKHAEVHVASNVMSNKTLCLWLGGLMYPTGIHEIATDELLIKIQSQIHEDYLWDNLQSS